MERSERRDPAHDRAGQRSCPSGGPRSERTVPDQRTDCTIPQQGEDVVQSADTLLRSLRSDRVSGLAHVVAEGAEARPFFLPKALDAFIYPK
jgi:hypothetical protein